MSYPYTPQNSDPSNNGNDANNNPYRQPPADQQYGQQAPQYPEPAPQYGQQAPQYGQNAQFGQTAPQYGAPGAYNQQPNYGQGYPSNNLGGWALGLSIAAYFFACMPMSIAAIVLGIKAKRAVREGRANNGGMGTAGIVLGWIGVIGGTLLIAGIFWAIAQSGGWEQFRVDWELAMNEASAA